MNELINTIVCADALDYLQSLPDNAVHCIITSPPYFGMRDYGTATWEGGDPECDHVKSEKPPVLGSSSTLGFPSDGGQRRIGADNNYHEAYTYQYKDTCGKCGAIRIDEQIGLEDSLHDYLDKLTVIFREARRVLREDGVMFVNMGSSYFGGQSVGWRDNGGTMSLDYRDGDYPTIHLCDECQDFLSTHIVRIENHRVLLSVVGEDAQTQEHKASLDSFLDNSGLIHQSQNGRLNHARLDLEPFFAHVAEQLPFVLVSTIAEFLPPPPGECLHCGNCGVCLSVLHSTERDGRQCARRGENTGDIISQARTWVARIVDKEPSFLASLYSTIVSRNYKAKDLVNQPSILAEALRLDGWYLRSEICWNKVNPMPESCTDRPTKSHEMIYLMTKAARYWYDSFAVREGVTGGEHSKGNKLNPPIDNAGIGHKDWHKYTPEIVTSRNKRTVWTVATHPYSEAHFATFPPKLIEPMVRAGCPPKVCCECGVPWTRVVEKEKDYHGVRADTGRPRNVPNIHTQGKSVDPNSDGHYFTESYWVKVNHIGWQPTCDHDADTEPGIVLDMFMGAGTTALVAIRNGRRFMGCDLNAEYVTLANKRISVPQNVDMFSKFGIET